MDNEDGYGATLGTFKPKAIIAITSAKTVLPTLLESICKSPFDGNSEHAYLIASADSATRRHDSNVEASLAERHRHGGLKRVHSGNASLEHSQYSNVST